MIAIIVLLIAAAVGWVVFTQLRARRLGVSWLFPCQTDRTARFKDKASWVSQLCVLSQSRPVLWGIYL